MEIVDIIRNTALTGVVAFVLIIALVRINGLRTFSKMSSYDFAATVATGSLLASILAGSVTIEQGGISLIILIAIQAIISLLRRKVGFGKFVDNEPLMLMDKSGFIEKNLKKANVTKADIVAKLRAANVASIHEVNAVVFETTGDVTVLHGHKKVNTEIMMEVRK